MRLLNYSKKEEGNKHLTYTERLMIERWYNKERKSKTEIARLTNKSERTIRREIRRGETIILTTLLEKKKVYSADKAQIKYEEYKKDKGPELKISDIELVRKIEREIIENKKSPEVVAYELRNDGTNICGRTIRNAIKNGKIFKKIKRGQIIYNKSDMRVSLKEKRVGRHSPIEKSIEKRPKEVDTREVYGDWEGDLVVGKQGTKTALFTLTERKTREEIIMKVPNRKTENIAKCLDKLERKYGKEFYSKFRTITFDNGSEFLGYEEIEKAKYRKGKRTVVYYAHPYRSGERGSNENNNRMIRRWIPKGIDMKNITNEFIKYIEDWINNYPRAMFGYKSTNMILSN